MVCICSTCSAELKYVSQVLVIVFVILERSQLQSYCKLALVFKCVVIYNFHELWVPICTNHCLCGCALFLKTEIPRVSVQSTLKIFWDYEQYNPGHNIGLDTNFVFSFLKLPQYYLVQWRRNISLALDLI